MQPARSYKGTVFDQFSRIGKAVANSTRLELLDLLCQGPHTVESLAEQTGHSIANTSHHLQVLRFNRLVEAEKDGLYVTYRLSSDEVCSFLRSLRKLAESRLAEIEQATTEFLRNHDQMEQVDPAGLLKRVYNCEATVIDVRPAEEYVAGHIPGAISIPLPELKQRIEELPSDREIVAYCRGPYCVLAVEAVELLSKRGFKASRLSDGVPDLRAQGFDVAVGKETGI